MWLHVNKYKINLRNVVPGRPYSGRVFDGKAVGHCDGFTSAIREINISSAVVEAIYFAPIVLKKILHFIGKIVFWRRRGDRLFETAGG